MTGHSFGSAFLDFLFSLNIVVVLLLLPLPSCAYIVYTNSPFSKKKTLVFHYVFFFSFRSVSKSLAVVEFIEEREDAIYVRKHARLLEAIATAGIARCLSSATVPEPFLNLHLYILTLAKRANGAAVCAERCSPYAPITTAAPSPPMAAVRGREIFRTRQRCVNTFITGRGPSLSHRRV